MSRLLSLVAGISGLFIAAMLSAQTPQQPLKAPPPPPPLEAENTWNLDLSTGGRVVIQLRADVAPNHVERIKTLTRQGFYNGLVFFRVIEGFMAQTGDPQNNGTGGSPLPNLNAEISGLLHVRGAVAAARTDDPNTANSQFYIMFTPRLNMDRNYSVFGRVVTGMNFVDAIVRGEPPASPSRILRASIGADNVPAMTAAEIEAENARFAAANAAPAAFEGPLELRTRPGVRVIRPGQPPTSQPAPAPSPQPAPPPAPEPAPQPAPEPAPQPR